jgi:hypothetical protein
VLREYLRLDKAHEIVIGGYLKPEGTIGVDWHVFDDHVSVNENVKIDHKQKIFYMRIKPVGTLRILCLSGQYYPTSD